MAMHIVSQTKTLLLIFTICRKNDLGAQQSHIQETLHQAMRERGEKIWYNNKG